MCRDDSVLEERRKMLVTWGFVRCLHNAVVTAIGHNCNCGCSCHVTTVSPSPVSHELNMISFVRLSVRLSHQLYTLKPITSTSEMTWHLECGETLKLIEIVKKTTVLWQTVHKNMEGRDRGTPDAGMHQLHICCTVRANCSFVICGNAEFFGCRMRQSDKG